MIPANEAKKLSDKGFEIKHNYYTDIIRDAISKAVGEGEYSAKIKIKINDRESFLVWFKIFNIMMNRYGYTVSGFSGSFNKARQKPYNVEISW